MTDDLAFWSYLTTEPLWWLICTILAYLAADRLSLLLKRHPLANPVLTSVCLIAVVTRLVEAPYFTYFDGAQFIHFLLGPATVELAVPRFSNRSAIRKLALPMAAALLVGSVTVAGTAVGFSLMLGLSDQIVISMGPKSATAPVAICISETLGDSVAHGRFGDPDRHNRCRYRYADEECASHTRLARPEVCRRHRSPRHRNSSGFSGQRNCRCVRWHRSGAECSLTSLLVPKVFAIFL